MSAQQQLRVGLIGLGLMGEPISRHLLDKGFELTVFDIDPGPLARAQTRGAAVASDPAEVARASNVILVVVPNNDDAQRVCLDGNGVLAGAAPDSVVVLCSSLTPEVCRRIDARAAAIDVGTLDAPMTGGIRGAEAASLTLLIGGEQRYLDRARSVLDAFSSASHHLGSVGSGQIGKTVNNLIHWGEIVVITEALALGAALGVDVSRMRPALRDASVDSRTLRELERMKFTWHAKDFADAFSMAESVSLELPAAEVAREEMTTITPERVARLLADNVW